MDAVRFSGVRFSGVRSYNGNPFEVAIKAREAQAADPLALVFHAQDVAVVLDGKDRDAVMWLYPKHKKAPNEPVDAVALSTIPKNPMPGSKPESKQHNGFLKRLEQMRADFVGFGQVVADYLGTLEETGVSRDGTPWVEENFDEPVDTQPVQAVDLDLAKKSA